jgi:hypothetical protein
MLWPLRAQLSVKADNTTQECQKHKQHQTLCYPPVEVEASQLHERRSRDSTELHAGIIVFLSQNQVASILPTPVH